MATSGPTTSIRIESTGVKVNAGQSSTKFASQECRKRSELLCDICSPSALNEEATIPVGEEDCLNCLRFVKIDLKCDIRMAPHHPAPLLPKLMMQAKKLNRSQACIMSTKRSCLFADFCWYVSFCDVLQGQRQHVSFYDVCPAPVHRSDLTNHWRAQAHNLHGA